MNYKIIGAFNVLLMSAYAVASFAPPKKEYNYAHIKEWAEHKHGNCHNEQECLYYKNLLEMIKEQPITDIESAIAQLSCQEKDDVQMHKNVLVNPKEENKPQPINKESLWQQWLVYASMLE